MKRHFLVSGGLAAALAALGGLPLPAATVEHKVTAVTVYRDRALVTRTGGIELGEGVQEIAFEGLPLGLDENSVRAQGSGRSGFKILGVEIRRQFREKPAATELAQAEEELERLGDEKRALEDDRQTKQEERNFLNQMRAQVLRELGEPAKDKPPASAKQLKEMLDFYGGELAKIAARLREIDLAQRKLSEQENELQRKISLLQRPEDPDTRTAVVTVEAKRPGSAELAVSYVIPGASWEPQYDAHADLKARQIELSYYGVVRQTTGENWDNVVLKLSTARPSAAARLPELSPWTIGLAVPMPMPEAAPASARRQRLEEMAQATAGALADLDQANRSVDAVMDMPAPAPAEMAVAVLQDTGPAALFEVPGRATIPSDGQPHRNTISVRNMKGEFSYEVTPKVAAAAYLKARVNNDSGAPLLPGNIHAFLGNDFIGKARIDLVSPNASFDLFLGPDDGIKVTRKADVAKEETGGILTALKVYKRGYKISVQNFKGTTEKFTVNDQIPVSQNGEVKVTAVRLTSADLERDDKTGKLVWKFELKPQQERTFDVEFQVECPAKTAVAGL